MIWWDIAKVPWISGIDSLDCQQLKISKYIKSLQDHYLKLHESGISKLWQKIKKAKWYDVVLLECPGLVAMILPTVSNWKRGNILSGPEIRAWSCMDLIFLFCDRKPWMIWWGIAGVPWIKDNDASVEIMLDPRVMTEERFLQQYFYQFI